MTETNTRDRNTSWWNEHPDFREKYGQMVRDTESLALSVVHWHHNVESARRHAPEKLDAEQFFLRQYATDATRAWLIAAQTEIETYPPSDAYWRGYGHTDQECLIRNLQVALDDFEANARAPYAPVPVGTPGTRSAGVR